MTETTSQVFNPMLNPTTKLVFFTYTKANTGDTTTVDGLTTIEGAVCLDATAGALDPVTFTTNVITHSTATGAGFGFAWGIGAGDA